MGLFDPEIFKEILRIYSIIPSKTAEIKSVILFLRDYSMRVPL